MDRYDSKLPLIFSPKGAKYWAVTIGQSTWYSVPESQVDETWRRHEEKHKEQWKREGWFKFAVKYLWYQLRYGYENNPYEIEANK